MAESKKLISKSKRLHDARQMLESVSEVANTTYYVFIGNHVDYENVNVIPQPNDSVSETTVDVYRNMIYGKRLTASDMKLMIKRNDYQSNKVYTMYDDRLGESNLALFDSNYYAIVNADAYYHVFKCLDNNNGANSTVQPEFAEVDAQDEFYQTSDGYVWKYMYSVDNTTVRKFATNEYFPVVANNQVAQSAVDGSLTIIKVESGGSGYDNYCNGIFSVSDLRLGGNTLHYAIDSARTASNLNDFYKNCYIYITAGTGVGQYARITDYNVNSTVKRITLDRQFTTPLAINSRFEISPGVTIVGDGTETADAKARAIVNATTNSIQRIEMLDLGANYKYATATVDAEPVVSVTAPATLRPIYSPPGGHGRDAAKELGSTSLGLSVKFSNTDISIPKTNDYRTIGILRDPEFANVQINFTAANGIFLPDETVYAVRGVKVSNSITTDISTANVTSSSDDFTNQFAAGEFVYIKTDSGYQFATVNSVTNSSHMTLSQNGYYSCTSATIYKTNIASTISDVELTNITLTGNVSVNTTSNKIIGTGTSFTTELTGNASHIFVYGNTSGGGVIKKIVSVANNTEASMDSNCSFANTNAKAQILSYTVSSDPILTSNSASAKVTSVAAGTIFVDGVKGLFNVGDFIIGSSSGATGSITEISRNGTVKNFDTFVQMNKYRATLDSGTFVEDEVVYQSATGLFADNYANGLLHSVTSVSGGVDLFVTNQLGVFNTSNTIVGYSSDSVATITNKYSPEVVFGSGEVIYIEKIDALNRTNTSAETLKFIFEF